MGVFQIESRAQMASLRRTRPETLDDLTIQVAIVRPGPILGGAVNPYIARRQQLREDPDYVVPYDHPSLEPVLKRHARHDHLPGPGARGRDRVRGLLARRGGGPAAGDEPQALGGGDRGLPPALRRGCDARTHGADEPTAERVYEMIMGFSGFGFPKAHGAAFGLLAYQSTWLRVHYGPEFLCALLNEQPMGFYASDTLVHEAQRRGIPLLRRRRQRQRGRPARPTARASASASAMSAACAPTRSPRSWRRARRAARSARSATSPRAPAPGGPRSPSSRGRARATRSAPPTTPPAARCCGSSGSPPPASRCRTARSSRCRSTSPPRPSCASSSRGSR